MPISLCPHTTLGGTRGHRARLITQLNHSQKKLFLGFGALAFFWGSLILGPAWEPAPRPHLKPGCGLLVQGKRNGLKPNFPLGSPPSTPRRRGPLPPALSTYFFCGQCGL